MRSCFLSSFIEFCSAVSEEKSKMPQPIRDQGGHLGFFFISAKNTNRVEDVEILLLVKGRWIPFSGFRGEVENVPANQRPGRSSCFSDWPEKYIHGRGQWDLASCQVSLNFVQRFQRRNRKCLRQSEARAAILFFFYQRGKNANMVEDVEILLPFKCRWIPFSGFRGKVENVSANQRPWRPSCFLIGTKNTNLVEDVEILLPCQVSSNSVQRFSEKSKMSQPIRGQGGHLVVRIGPKNANLVEDFGILLSVKFRWISFPSARKTQTWFRALRSCFLSSFVEFRSAVSEEKSKISQPIRGQGGYLVFPIGPKNTNLVEDVEFLLPVKFRWILLAVAEEKSKMDNAWLQKCSSAFGSGALKRWPPRSLIGRYIFEFFSWNR